MAFVLDDGGGGISSSSSSSAFSASPLFDNGGGGDPFLGEPSDRRLLLRLPRAARLLAPPSRSSFSLPAVSSSSGVICVLCVSLICYMCIYVNI